MYDCFLLVIHESFHKKVEIKKTFNSLNKDSKA